jgi:hypothetical protein
MDPLNGVDEENRFAAGWMTGRAKIAIPLSGGYPPFERDGAAGGEQVEEPGDRGGMIPERGTRTQRPRRRIAVI